MSDRKKLERQARKLGYGAEVVREALGYHGYTIKKEE